MALTRRSFIVGSAIATLLAHSRAAVSQALEGTVAVTGGNVVWRRFGDGPKAPLLLIHGGPGAPSEYLEPFAALGDERAVFVWDQLGCGRSARPSDSSLWTLERFVAELDAVRKTLAPGPVHVLGHSWGSMLAIEWLATARPAAVESVIFAGPCLSVPRYIEDVTDLVATLTPESRAAIAEADRTGDYGSAAYQKAMNEDWAPRYLARTAGPNNDFLNRTFAGFGAETYEFIVGAFRIQVHRDTQEFRPHRRSPDSTRARAISCRRVRRDAPGNCARARGDDAWSRGRRDFRCGAYDHARRSRRRDRRRARILDARRSVSALPKPRLDSA